MKLPGRLLAVAALLLLLAAPALAQGRLIIRDELGQIDSARLQRAAQPLINRGITVAVYLVRNGSADDFLNRLVSDDLVRGNLARQKMVAVYVGTEGERFSQIRFGEDPEIAAALGVADNADNIVQGTLNPGLRSAISSGDFTPAFADALTAIEEAIVTPPGNPIVDTAPIAGGLVAIAAAGAGGYVLVRRRRAARLLKDARDAMGRAREQAGAAIADLGQRFRKLEDQAKFDKVSYGPADVDALARMQQEARALFVKVQTEFDDVGEGLNRYAENQRNVGIYNGVATAYGRVAEQATQVSSQLDAIEARRAELDRLAKQAPGEIDRAKKS